MTPMMAILENHMAKTMHMKNNSFIGFLGSENICVDTKIGSLSSIIMEIFTFVILYGGHFEKWLPRPSHAKFSRDPVLNLVAWA